MDVLTWPNVTLDQFYDIIPEIKHLENSLQERILIEGIYLNRKRKEVGFVNSLCCIGRYKPFLKRQEMEVAALKRDEHLTLDINLDYLRYNAHK